MSASAEEMQELAIVQPDPGAMLASLRAIGYSLPAAVADIVDNSITAGARRIAIRFDWRGSASRVLITDDGAGMSAEGLTEAMRLGGKGPNAARSQDDLGRFGLGLKTASFSQCRKLTVVTRDQPGPLPSAATWDLDHVAKRGEWALLAPARFSLTGDVVGALEDRPGTVVIWEELDRVVTAADADDAEAAKRFRQQIRTVEEHLSAVFHRFLSGRGRVELSIQGNAVKPWDPFMRDHLGTQCIGEEQLVYNTEAIDVAAFVLPHRSKLTGAEHRAGGRGDWNGRQGFYVYRNRRLLLAGDWMRMFASEEHHKLARIRVDLPNTLDAEWQIDVKKAVARPPSALRDELRRIAIATRRRAAEVYQHRGKVVARSASGTGAFLWERRSIRGRIAYRLNRDHPLLRELLDERPDRRGRLEALLRLTEETVPVPLIVLDSAESPDEQSAPFEASADSDILEVMTRVLDSLVARGATPAEALRQLAGADPFSEFPHLIQVLKERDVLG